MISDNIRPVLFMLFLSLFFCGYCFGLGGNDILTDDIELFINMLDEAEDDSTEVIEVGNRIFTELGKKYSLSPGFVNLKSRLQSAGFLANKMQSQLRKSMGKRLLEVTNDGKRKKKNSLIVAPAKSFYDSSRNLFNIRVDIDDMPENEKVFFMRYYNLILRKHIQNISIAGLGYAVAEPGFKSTYDYVLVLPLLHSSDSQPINLEMLPLSMKSSKLLNLLADSALLHFGRVFASMSLAKSASEIGKSSFDEIDYYVKSAKKCPSAKANIAVDCLNMAIKAASKSQPERIVDLNIEIIDIWQKSGNYALAASHARQIYERFANHSKAGYVIWLYYYSLSRGHQAEVVLADIDEYIDNPICSNYRANLMYTKWWAMRLSGKDATQLQALEYQFMNDYSDSSIISPVMLSQATDMIARQNYKQAYAILDQLIEKFPNTRSAIQAKKIIDKLKNKNWSS